MREAYDLTVCNTVHTLVMDTIFDLRAAAELLHGRYARDIFTAVSFRLMNPFTTVSLFDSGQEVITGATNYMDALLAANQIVYQLWRKTGIVANLYNLGLQNVVGSLALGYRLNLDLFYYHNKMECSYDPEFFPGLHYSPKHSKVVLMLFTSGAMVITGAVNVDHLYEVYERLKDMFPKYKLGEEQLQMDEGARKTRRKRKREIQIE